ncbi:MAG: phenylalanine--tRNA ligase subunit alpha [Deltaproteobacteria bacterium]|nr:phenylalanine--tRNA ligase subunit alpha [Deltaproteobacteria bacterium]MBI3386229.1 phenylalanine--tRNA ligase subunit alpha [Deltaproteobacteria bacterium]
MKETLEQIRSAALAALAIAKTDAEIELLRVQYLGRKGELTLVVRQMRDVAPEDRPAMGVVLNAIKDELETRITQTLVDLRAAERARRASEERVDITLPGRRRLPGSLHPLTQVMEELIAVFGGLGFSVVEGPDVEDDYHNFEALNIPHDHPARDMQDTLFVSDELVLRTHTSPVQIRVMEAQPPPLRVIVPGAAYRHDYDMTHSPMFHQIEGLMVDKRVTFADLKGVLTLALQRLFGSATRVRFRPSFFQFTEPSAEVDIECFQCGGRDTTCRLCKATGWLEILGCGLVDPNVFRFVGYDPEQVSGFAFGIGIERVAMLKYEITDIRLLYGSDLRFLRQF